MKKVYEKPEIEKISFQAEEKEWPQRVDCQLQPIKLQWLFAVGIVANVYQIGGNGHQNVKDGPRHGEQPSGRRQRRFDQAVQRHIPAKQRADAAADKQGDRQEENE